MAGGAGSTFLRVCYLIFPFLLTLFSTALLIVSFMDQTSGGLNNLYYLRLDTSKINLSAMGSSLTSDIGKVVPSGVASSVAGDITSVASNFKGDITSLASSFRSDFPSALRPREAEATVEARSLSDHITSGFPVAGTPTATGTGSSASATSTGGSVPGVQAYYDIGLWNYCSGTDINKGPNFCSPVKSWGWAFNPLEAWGININQLKDVVPQQWQSGINAYQRAVHWLFIAYIISIASAGVTLILGLMSFFLHRISSVITSIAATVAAVAISMTAATATAIYVIFGALVNDKLGQYDIHASLGKSLFIITWISTGMSIVAAFLWYFGCCCGGGRTNKRQDPVGRGRGGPGWGPGPEAYQRLPSPSREGAESLLRPEYNSSHSYAGGGYPMTQWQKEGGAKHERSASTGYEPYRSGGRGISDSGDLGA